MNFLKISAYALVGALLLAPIPRTGWTTQAYAASSDDADSITVETAGTGVDEDKALRQALKNAVMQAVGGIVDAETVSKNDEVIKDQILTASRAIVAKVERVGKPRVEDGLVTVQIRAVVQKKLLVTRLQDAKVMAVAKVDGESMWAKMATELENEKDAAKIVERVFEGTATAFIKAEVFGKPEVVGKKDGMPVVRTKFKFSIDEKKYAEWKKSAVPLLERIAVKSVSGKKCASNVPNRQPKNSPDGYLAYNSNVLKYPDIESPLCLFVRDDSGKSSYPKIYSMPLSTDMARAIVHVGKQMPIVAVDYMADDGKKLASMEYPLGWTESKNGRHDIGSYLTGCYSMHTNDGFSGAMSFLRQYRSPTQAQDTTERWLRLSDYDGVGIHDRVKAHPESIQVEHGVFVGMLFSTNDHFSSTALILQYDMPLTKDALKSLKEVRVSLHHYSPLAKDGASFEKVEPEKVLVLDAEDKDAIKECGNEGNWFQRNLQKDGASSSPAPRTSPFAPAVPSFRLRK